MGRDVDERKKRAALRKLRRAAQLAEQGLGPPLSDWERQFLEEVEERIETYGSAFADPLKGDEGEPLSVLQQVKLKEIDKKARGKARKGFGQKKGGFNKRPVPRVRQLGDDIEPEEEAPQTSPPMPRELPKLVRAADLKTDEKPEQPECKAPQGRPVFRVINGGKTD
ncbi:hypothetical protein [Hyphomonas pacifica]|uniref:Uncharacterized protein n=1 Tax=Hyphomonas pacifica TaxID=1280941 RepID=A0A062TU39_9PROT|nr:hypothetical protein [Hyphomonas pacifica]KCZ51501.1 hypothetical protein HY2_11455 [Hyphomonas pacifica]RAN35521.1 hypothetical protein HY3_08245 [Hyphomonas pacifica]RAN36823.1 hypothetical protein HY11_11310 [Hyphomonas pacifica]